MSRNYWLAPMLAIGLVSVVQAKEPPPAKAPPAEAPPGKAAPSGEGKLKKYDDVITKDAQTLTGVFAVHRIEDKVFLEIPQSAQGRLMLWQAEVAKGPAGVSWGGQSLGHAVVRWERRGNKVFLWKAAFDKRSDNPSARTAVDLANFDTIIASFPIECEGKDRSAVINATAMFTTDMPDLSIKGAVGGNAGPIDEARSYLSEVKAFPTNIEIRSLLTFRPGAGGPAPAGPFAGGGSAGRSSTVIVHYSLVQLPEKPMMGRLFDPRVGYFTESFEKYDDPKNWVVNRSMITRFRLEKKDPTAEISEPIKPIVFYLSPEIPEKWRPFLKKGVEDWKPAFEQAGFKNAIICRDAPTRAEDPNWDPEDARYSVIRWVAEPIANAMGPNVHDPRSGEVISAHIVFWHDIAKLSQMWYFVQCSAQDARARTLPLPDDLTGELIRYVSAHEVGHTLGLRHNHRASQAYSVEQLRNPEFTAKYGSVASIMSYGRFNYVCQPEDNIKSMIPILAPYDFFAIMWGYKPIPGAKTPDEEKPTLDEWASRQLQEPFLRFGGEDGPSTVDPTVLTENIGNDPMKATALGLKNLDRVLDHLVPATTRKGEDFALLQEAYGALMTHRRNWFNAVAKQVGGVVENRALGGRGGVAFSSVPKEKQKEAVNFLLENAFVPPNKMLNPEIVSQFRYTTVANDIMSQQQALLENLLSASRLNNLFDQELLGKDKAYQATEFIKDLQDGIWSELKAEHPQITPIRRRLQRAYLERLKSEFDAAPAASAAPAMPSRRGNPFAEMSSTRISELRAVSRTALQDLAKRINAAIPQVDDQATKAHLLDSASMIEQTLNPKAKS